MRTCFALAAGLIVTVSAFPASAGGPSYEGRGYGGPLYVGPNFEQGGQHAPPVYGNKPAASKERAVKKRVHEVTKTREAPAAKEADTEKDSSDKAATAGTGGPVAASVEDTGGKATAAAPAAPATCKHFDATSGQTITVPCK
jgi:hypothetical protein